MSPRLTYPCRDSPLHGSEGAQLEVGQKTLAIGNPFGLDHTLTTGVISALGRDVMGYGGDVIVGIDDQPIRNFDDLFNALDTRAPGDLVRVQVRRNTAIVEVRVQLAEM